ncbi:hypothetical protein P7228_02430 [Altererythrobacter arenosus]|uniref:Uncharacterized protein n=1 Tax=Altererythrobacter arenosus TaxID=3032592 RepID=A0ABY8FVH0_9SPHN|nr:hypothetical protein [Altererythrobacter sp. CAU 1644]WFL77943.1 hypothetical protein P7228_02430 [Altererythrobacter sp. CAU 1644]
MTRLKYSDAMESGGAQVRLRLGTDEPVALSDFVGNFVGIGNQFEKFLAAEHPDLRADTEFFVQKVRGGSIEADLVAWIVGPPAAGATLAAAKWAIERIDQGQILADFVRGLGKRINPYFKKGGRFPNASKADLSDFLKTTKAINRDPKGNATIEAAVFEDGERKVRAEFKFTSEDARRAETEIKDHMHELDQKSDENQERVLLRFVRPSVEAGKPGKKGGERGIIASIAKRALPILYASTLAEERMKYELMQLDGNIFRAHFDVSVNIEMNAKGRPVAYRVTHVHNVIEDGDDDLLGQDDD